MNNEWRGTDRIHRVRVVIARNHGAQFGHIVPEYKQFSKDADDKSYAVCSTPRTVGRKKEWRKPDTLASNQLDISLLLSHCMYIFRPIICIYMHAYIHT